MSMYICFQCHDMLDGDFFPCEEHPTKENELVCEDCLIELTEEEE